MQTTYRLQPNVTWHDGVPLTAQDFVFAWAVTSDPELVIDSRAVSNEIARIETPDDLTLVIEWKQPYSSAHAIVTDDLGPFPSHILKPLYETGNKEQFSNSPWWTRQFVGVGPFRVVDWQPGSFVMLEAYEGFYAGRAKIDRIVIQYITNAQTRLANLRAGSADWTAFHGGLGVLDALQLKREWEQDGEKPTLRTSTGSMRQMWVQLRTPAVRELFDVRVRHGLLAALDRSAMTDARAEGLAPVADTFIPPDDVRWEWVKDMVVRHPYDPRRAEALFGEAGLRRGPDGIFENAQGVRMILPHWGNTGTQNEQELALAGDQWKGFGVLTEQTILSRPQQEDRQFRVSFPGFTNAAFQGSDLNAIQTRFSSNQCPSAQNGWTGQNYGCYQNPVADRLLEQIKGAIDPEQQRAPLAELARLYSQDLPSFPLYFDVTADLFRQSLSGVRGSSRILAGVGPTWNIEEWNIERS
jgi:peptide/nickel transport system substrate-binding protein